MKTKTRFLFLNILLCLAMLIGTMAVPSIAPAAQPGSQSSYIIQGLAVVQLSALVERYGGVVSSRFEIIDAVAATLPAGAAARIAAEPGIKLSPNARVQASGDASTIPSTDYPNETGATVAWQQGAMGAGVSVAVVDTGISLMDGLLHNPQGKAPKLAAWKDFVDKSKDPIDPNGHG